MHTVQPAPWPARHRRRTYCLTIHHGDLLRAFGSSSHARVDSIIYYNGIRLILKVVVCYCQISKFALLVSSPTVPRYLSRYCSLPGAGASQHHCHQQRVSGYKHGWSLQVLNLQGRPPILASPSKTDLVASFSFIPFADVSC